jgi:glycyl-tRNA synthetase
VAGLAYRTDYDLARHIAYSKVDLKVFKAYPVPEIEKVKIIKPSPKAIKEDFKNEADKIFKLLSFLNPEETERAFKEKGFFEIENFKIYPTHVQLIEKQIKESGKKFIPHVVEPSFGVERLIYAVMEYSYFKIEDRVVMKIPKDLAPLQIGVFPLVSKEELTQKAWSLYLKLLNYGFNVFYDEEGSIGRRYARADEAGVPIAITIDRQTLKDETVTLRDRDSWKQIRVNTINIEEKLRRYFNEEVSFEELND